MPHGPRSVASSPRLTEKTEMMGARVQLNQP
jgi:hypothetical protein